MPKAAKISDLPLEIIEILHKKIRDSAYCNVREITEWLTEQGFHMSKSAVHKYMQKLKVTDGFEGKAGSVDLVVQMNTRPFKDHSLAKLYAELGELEYKKSLILSEISRQLYS